MDRHEALRRIDATLKARGFKETGPGFADYEGSIPVHGTPVDITLSIPDVRFAAKPVLTLKDRSQIPLDTRKRPTATVGGRNRPRFVDPTTARRA